MKQFFFAIFLTVAHTDLVIAKMYIGLAGMCASLGLFFNGRAQSIIDSYNDL